MAITTAVIYIVESVHIILLVLTLRAMYLTARFKEPRP